MERTKRVFFGAVTFVATLSLSGCWVGGAIGCAQGFSCSTPKVSIGVGDGDQPPNWFGGSLRAKATRTLVADASSLYIDVDGTDYDVGSSGQAAITLFDDDGQILDAESFAWVRSGSHLVFQSPVAVESWAASYPSATGADATLDAGVIPADGQSHQLSFGVVYEGVEMASASRSFAAWCQNSTTHTRYLCSQ